MTDVHSIEVRSYNMSRIQGKNTKPEMLVRKFLYHCGLRYRIHEAKIAGKPDIFLPRYKTAVFINGCFWHSHHNCRYFVLPKTRTEWWKHKLEKTKIRDLSVKQQLKKEGVRTFVVWECELKNNKAEKTLEKLLLKITA